MAWVKQKYAPSKKIREARIIVSGKALYQLKLEGENWLLVFFSIHAVQIFLVLKFHLNKDVTRGKKIILMIWFCLLEHLSL